MLVVIPHPSENLKLIKLQKNMISALVKKGFSVYRQLPLWIPLYDDAQYSEAKNKKEVLKTAGKELKEIIIENAFYSPEAAQLKLKITIKTNASCIEKEMPFIHFTEKTAPETSASFSELLSLPEKIILKIFRIGISGQEGKAHFIKEAVWIKN